MATSEVTHEYAISYRSRSSLRCNRVHSNIHSRFPAACSRHEHTDSTCSDRQLIMTNQHNRKITYSQIMTALVSHTLTMSAIFCR